MSTVTATRNDDPRSRESTTLFARADAACAFGPSFFMGHLGRFVRDRCPDATEHLPVVRMRLSDGETLDVCHIIGVSPHWVMLAVHDGAHGRDEMAIAMVPYDAVVRVTVSTRHAEASSIGFAQVHAPEIIAPEALLKAAMGPAATAAS